MLHHDQWVGYAMKSYQTMSTFCLAYEIRVGFKLFLKWIVQGGMQHNGHGADTVALELVRCSSGSSR